MEPLWLDLHLAGRLAGRYGPEAVQGHPAPAGELQRGEAPLAGQDKNHNLPALAPWLRLWQWEHLLLTLERALTHSRHYARLLTPQAVRAALAEAESEAGLPPGFAVKQTLARRPDGQALALALTGLTARLPFTLPSDLEADPDSFLAVSHDDVDGLISISSSGTTGRGKRIFSSAEDLTLTADFFQHGMQYLAGPGRAQRVALLMSGDRPGSVGHLLRRGLEALGVACFVPGFMGPGREGEEAMMRALLEIGPDCLVGVPGQMLALARHRLAPALARSVRAVLLSGDTVTGALRAGIAAGLNCEVLVHYGLTETGLGGAVECRQKAGPHLREADLLAEIVDEKGRALPPGQWGEIVLTTLTRRAMPLLRYRTGDEGRLEKSPCVCGSILARLTPRGRLDASLALPGGDRLTLADLDERLYALPFVRGYRAVLHRAPGRGASLWLDLRLEGPPDDALQRAARSLGDLPGLDPRPAPAAPGPQGLAKPGARPRNPAGPRLLPVLLRRDESAPSARAQAGSRAKQRFEYSGAAEAGEEP